MLAVAVGAIVGGVFVAFIISLMIIIQMTRSAGKPAYQGEPYVLYAEFTRLATN